MPETPVTCLVLCNTLAGVTANVVRKAIAEAKDGVAFVDVRGNVDPINAIRIIPIPDGSAIVDIPVMVLRQKGKEDA
jgi:hypothetical protein